MPDWTRISGGGILSECMLSIKRTIFGNCGTDASESYGKIVVRLRNFVLPLHNLILLFEGSKGSLYQNFAILSVISPFSNKIIANN